VFIGQAFGPFMLSCHMDHDYEKDRRSPALLQCAGAAIFRANVGVDALLPDALLHLEPDAEAVFETPAELLAHHANIPLEAAQKLLRLFPPRKLLENELGKQGVQQVKLEKQ
jgi:hypothetical protein